MSALPTYVGADSVSNTTGNPTIQANPTGCIAGDLLVLVVQTNNQAGSTPSGWTEAPNSPQGIGTGGTAGACRIHVYYRFADNDRTNFSFGDTGDHTFTQVYAFRGVNAIGSPFDVTIGGTASSSTSYSATGGTTTVDNCLAVIIAGNGIDGFTTDQMTSWPTNSDLANLTQRAFNQQLGNNGGGWNIATGEKATAGTFGATTGTLATAGTQAFLTLMLKPPVHPFITGIGAQAASSVAISPAWPTTTSYAADDIGLMFVQTAGGEALTSVTGWTQLPSSPQATGAGSAGTQISAWWKRATSSSETAPTVGDVGTEQLAFIITIRGCPTSSSPIDSDAGNVKGSASTSVSITGTTTTTNNCIIFAAATRDNSSATAEFSAWTNASLENLNELRDQGSTQGNGMGIGVAYGFLGTAGATGTTTATTTNSVLNACMTVAQKFGGGGVVGFSWAAVVD